MSWHSRREASGMMRLVGLAWLMCSLVGSAHAEEPTAPPSGSPTTTVVTPPIQPSTMPPSPSIPSVASPGDTQSTAHLRDIERKVDELKEQIFRSKARLNLLKETVLHGVIAGARATIVHRNDMGAMYTPIRYVYALDGAEIFARTDETGKLGKSRELEIYTGSLAPGNHTLSVQMVYQGNGFGMFSYLKGYKFIARSSYTFTATEGKQLQLKVIGFERGNALTTDPKDRPSIDFRQTVTAEAGMRSGTAQGKK